jgi:hypothetical protein
MFRQCGILDMFLQCGILDMFLQCGILDMFQTFDYDFRVQSEPSIILYSVLIG